MRIRLIQFESGAGFSLDQSIVDALGVAVGAEFELTTDGQRLVLEPAVRRDEKLLAASARVMAAHDETFRKLAQ